MQAANLAGPLLAGVFLGAGGASAAFTAAGALFGASLVMLVTLRLPQRATAPPVGHGMWQQFTEGLLYGKRRTGLRRLVMVIGLSELCFSGPIAVAVVFLVDERHWGSATAGWILGAFSVGGAAVAALMAVFAERMGRVRVVLTGSLVLTAVLLVVWGALGRLGAIAIAAVLGATTGVTTVVANARLQSAAAPQYLGRTTSVTTLFTVCAVVCGAAAAVAAVGSRASGSEPTPSGRPTGARAGGRPTPARPRTPPRSPRR